MTIGTPKRCSSSHATYTELLFCQLEWGLSDSLLLSPSGWPLMRQLQRECSFRCRLEASCVSLVNLYWVLKQSAFWQSILGTAQTAFFFDFDAFKRIQEKKRENLRASAMARLKLNHVLFGKFMPQIWSQTSTNFVVFPESQRILYNMMIRD